MMKYIIQFIKGCIAIIAVLNLVALFAFGYEIPGLNLKNENSETGISNEDSFTTAVASVENPDDNENPGGATTTDDKAENIPVKELKCRVNISQNARIRSGPGVDYDRITSVPTGTVMTIIGEENGWYNVRLEDGTEGYVSAELVEILD